MADGRVTIIPNVTVVGNLTRDPELRFTQGGKAITSFGIAVNRRKQVAGEWRDEEPAYFTITAWEQLGENLASSLTKGTRVIVSGRLEQRTYTTQGGESRTVLEITADEVGPSLRYATAQVERTDRRSADGAAAPQGAAPRSAEPAYYPDEEPF
jgi:single-strand DNA-binding protein